jgi:hypothetical protein
MSESSSAKCSRPAGGRRSVPPGAAMSGAAEQRMAMAAAAAKARRIDLRDEFRLAERARARGEEPAATLRARGAPRVPGRFRVEWIRGRR